MTASENCFYRWQVFKSNFPGIIFWTIVSFFFDIYGAFLNVLDPILVKGELLWCGNSPSILKPGVLAELYKNLYVLVRTWNSYLFSGDYTFHQSKRSCITTLLDKSCFYKVNNFIHGISKFMHLLVYADRYFCVIS